MPPQCLYCLGCKYQIMNGMNGCLCMLDSRLCYILSATIGCLCMLDSRLCYILAQENFIDWDYTVVDWLDILYDLRGAQNNI
ncbi:hypothetical protein ACJX0J_024025, partial [Zea mays]